MTDTMVQVESEQEDAVKTKMAAQCATLVQQNTQLTTHVDELQQLLARMRASAEVTRQEREAAADTVRSRVPSIVPGCPVVSTSPVSLSLSMSLYVCTRV